ncbi:MAG: fibronectin type III domain-containing protein [Elusimicrobia bacterium]|nr:fibronectin type III domain-containing protein [Elusimicrobiota bacterium]
MNLRRTSLAAFFLIVIGASRLHASPSVAFSSITYCLGADPVATDNSPTVYTTVPSWYVGFTAPAPGFQGGSYPRKSITGTRLLLHFDNDGNDSSGGQHHIANPVPGNHSDSSMCVDAIPNPGTAVTSWGATGTGPTADFLQNLTFIGNYSTAKCCKTVPGCAPAAKSYAYSSAYAVVPTLDSVFYNRSFSVELWVKASGVPTSPSGNNDRPILEQCQAAATLDQCLHLTLRNGKPHLGFYSDDLEADSSIADGAWHHLVFTFDYNSKYQTIYVDGLKVKERTAGNTYQGTTGTVYLGIAPNVSAGDNFNGQLDDIRIVNYEMPPGQVAADYAGQAYYADWLTPTWRPIGGFVHGSKAGTMGIYLGVIHTPTSGTNQTAQDEDENMAYRGLSITVDQTGLMLPPNPTVPMVGATSITWNWSSYACNTCKSPYAACGVAPGKNTTYTINTNASGPGSPNSYPYYSPTGLTPNTVYTLSYNATYVDTGGSGKTAGPSGSSGVSTVRTLAARPNVGPDTITGTGPTSVTLKAHIRDNPDDTRCAVIAKENGVYQSVTSFAKTKENDVISIVNLPKSSHFVFAIQCENDEGKFAERGPDSGGDPPASFVSQPATPTGLTGNLPAGPVICPKTTINWTWSPVIKGSAYPASANATPYQVSRMNGDGSISAIAVCGPPTLPNGQTNCVETGLAKGTSFLRVVQAQDTGAYTQWSDTSSTAGFSTTGDFTDAPANLTGVSGNNVITWNWTPPVNICVPFRYLPFDAVTGAAVPIPPNPSLGDLNPGSQPNPPWTQTNDLSNAPLGTNTLYSLQLRAQDSVTASYSPLSLSASAYTLADAPANLRAAAVSTGSVKLQWDSTNPPYTRFEVSMSPLNDLLQPVSISTLVYITNNWTSNSYLVNGLNAGSTYYFRVRAANGRAEDGFGGLLTNFAILASTVTRPQPPELTGTGTNITTVKWDWSAHPVTGAVGYKLVSDAEVPILDNPNTSAVTISSGPFRPNTACGAKIASYNSNGEYGPYSAVVYAFTKANPPTAPGITGASSDTVNLSWNPNNNASYTFYQIILATDSLYGVVAATVSVMSTFTAISGLFPGATYYAQVQAINGGQIGTGFVPAGSICTKADNSVTRSTAPTSPYAIPPGLIGLWHLDEDSGTRAKDASAWANTGGLACLDIPANCSALNSTPTFTTDAPPDLGHAVSFSGIRNSLLSIPPAAQYDFTDSLTLSAWVKPATAVQTDGAGLVTKGVSGDESFSLELTNRAGAPRYLFRTQMTGPHTATIFGTSTVRTGQWDLVTAVFDRGPANQATLYINGIFASSATVSWPRVTNTAPISVGNRKDGTGNYNLGFSGVIDDIRLLNTALSAAQAADLYHSYFPTQLTPPGVNSAIQLLLPPNAFPSAASIYVSSDPISHPLRISSSLLAQALSRPPTGQMLMPPSQAYPTLLEIVPTLDGVNYFNGALGSSASLSLPYADANGDGIVDGSNPSVPAARLQLYTLNTSILAWEALPTSVNTVDRRVSALVSHFSIFGLFGATSYGQTASAVRVYPVPWKIGTDGLFGTPTTGPCKGVGLAFGCEQLNPNAGCLPTSGSIRILTLSGEKVIDLPFSSTDAGTKCWDGRNTAGKRVASGVYFAQVKSSQDGSSRILRFAIEK